MRVAVGNKEGVSFTGKAAHAAVGAAFHADLAPEVFISEQNAQYAEGSGAGALGGGIAAGAADILYLSGCGESFVFVHGNGCK